MKVFTREDPCSFVRGEKILVSDNKHGRWQEKELYVFDKKFRFPFLCITKDSVIGWMFAKKIQSDLKHAQMIWVKDKDESVWKERPFNGWGKDGRVIVYSSPASWDEYTLEDPNKCK